MTEMSTGIQLPHCSSGTVKCEKMKLKVSRFGFLKPTPCPHFFFFCLLGVMNDLTCEFHSSSLLKGSNITHLPELL